MTVAALHRTLDQELVALLRGASLECLVCGEFVMHAHEGVFCEPSSAASVAALLEAAADGLVQPGSTVVCVLTGHGLKDPDTAGSEGAEILRCPPLIEQLELIAFANEPVLA